MSGFNITHPEFEYSVDLDDYLKRCIKHIRSGLSRNDLKSVLYQVYETEYGIHDHLAKTNRPLSSVAFFDIENSLDGSPLDSIMRTYASKNIKEVFGLSLFEFLEMPRDILELMINIANEEMKKKQPVLDQLNSEFNKLK